MKKFLAILLALVLCVALMVTFCLAAGEAIPTAAMDTPMDFGITPVVAITVICYLVAAALKATALDNKWLPVICGAVGGVLGYIAMRIMPAFPAQDLLTAIAVGIVSGLAATGFNQVCKQFSHAKTE